MATNKVKFEIADGTRGFSITAGGTMSSADKKALLESSKMPGKPVKKDDQGRPVEVSWQATVELPDGSEATGIITEGGRKELWTTDDGEIVDKQSIREWVIDPETGQEVPFKAKSYTPTVGAGKTQRIARFEPVSKLSDFLILDYLDIIPEEGQEGNLYTLAKHLTDNGLIGMGTAVLRSNTEPVIIILTAEVDATSGSFRVTALTTAAKTSWKRIPIPGGPPAAGVVETEAPDLLGDL